MNRRPIVSACLALAMATLAQPTAARALSCGDTIPAGSTVTLTADLGPCPGPFALRIEGPATFDFANRRITCADGGTGLVITGRNVKVTKGLIDECDTGIALSGSNHRLSVTMIADFRVAGVDFVGRVTGSRLEDLNLFAPTFSGLGVGVRMGNDDERNTLIDVFVVNARDGFRVRGSRNRLEGCHASGIARAGFDVAGSRHALVDSKAVFGTGDGFALFAAQEVTLARNEADLNDGVGFRLEASRKLRVERNTALRSGGHGILLDDVVEAQVTRNRVDRNGGDGIRVADGSTLRKIVIGGNTASRHAAPNVDLRDEDPSCTNTKWQNNEFARALPACVN